MERKKFDQNQSVAIPLPKREKLTVKVEGDTPYVGTNYSEDTRKELADKQSGKSKLKARAPRDIDAEINGRRTIKDGIDCIPAGAFRAAMVDTAKDDSLTAVNGEMVKRSVIVQGDLGNFMPIRKNGTKENFEPSTFESVVKLANGLPHIAYRPMYENWTTDVTIIYIADKFTHQDILNLLARAGITTGVGDTRKIGGGRYHLAGQAEVEEI